MLDLILTCCHATDRVKELEEVVAKLLEDRENNEESEEDAAGEHNSRRWLDSLYF